VSCRGRPIGERLIPARTAPQIEEYSVSLHHQEERMNQIIYIVGLIVIVVAILSFFGLR
jgi:hypothetical protein